MRCPAWDFLSGRCGQSQTYCEMQGGTIEEGSNVGTCQFTDGSSCDEYSYFSSICKPGDYPSETAEELVPTEEAGPSEKVIIQIKDFISARDFLVAYILEVYGIETTDPWMEANITSADAEGVTTFRYVSGPLWIEVSAEASAPYAALYTFKEVSFIANGFRWEGTLAIDGSIVETNVVPPWSVLNPEQARDAALAYMAEVHSVAASESWVDEGISSTENNTVLLVYTSGSWSIEVEFAPSAPLVPSYKVVVENASEGILWQGDISGQGNIVEISFSQ
jgi:hypothetical protein